MSANDFEAKKIQITTAHLRDLLKCAFISGVRSGKDSKSPFEQVFGHK